MKDVQNAAAAAAGAEISNMQASPSAALASTATTAPPQPPPPSRRQPPITYPWRSLASLNDLAAAVHHYLDRRAQLSSGVPDSLDDETNGLLASLKDLCSLGFATLSSQPGIKDDRSWQRFYITGVLPDDKAPQILAALQARSFITLLSTPETTTIHVPTPEALPPPPESIPPQPQPNSAPPPPPPPAKPSTTLTTAPCIPLTVARHAHNWRTVTDIPLPAPLSELMADPTSADERRNVVMEDDGALFEHHFDTNFGRFGLTKKFRRALMTRAVVVTLAYPAWGETDRPLADVLEVLRQEMGSKA
ncbi:hypothetical protein HDU87_003426 [Geranomyces variabilis]|uniref:DUF6919 domain-containing protein n=1 Tax=Geranomyces variabilis TaxID=109894 RepID=A0AAD5XQH9_9FUNG|nr:hypothetical protein HDU87_003426 [Geranomyces variabilis]